MLAHLRALTEDGRLRALAGVLAPLPCKMTANILKRGLLYITRDITVDLVQTSLAFAPVGDTDRVAPDFFCQFLTTFAGATISSVPEW